MVSTKYRHSVKGKKWVRNLVRNLAYLKYSPLKMSLCCPSEVRRFHLPSYERSPSSHSGLMILILMSYIYDFPLIWSLEVVNNSIIFLHIEYSRFRLCSFNFGNGFFKNVCNVGIFQVFYLLFFNKYISEVIFFGLQCSLAILARRPIYLNVVNSIAAVCSTVKQNL